MYAIIDIETTGGSPLSEKITEIALYIHDGFKIINEYSTLINPEKNIPYFITNLTGITNEMVSDAPKFYEIAKQIIEMTQDCIFVAHNVSFDYHFIRHEYKRLGYNFSRERLCTVQLSRQLIPGYPSYSLGKICDHLNIRIEGRHRASGDAFATVKLFEHLLKLSDPDLRVFKYIPGLSKKDLHPGLNPSTVENLPEATGVYYFYNDKKELIYIGKSKNIRSRVYSHLNNFVSKKAIEMRLNIADISYEITGSELISLLKESHEIKKFKPIYNHSQRRAFSQFGIYKYLDSEGYIRFTIATNSRKKEPPLCSFSNQKAAKSYLQEFIDKYNLCQKLCGLYNSSGACFHYEITECFGACIGKEPAESYNQRANIVIELHKYKFENSLIIEEGRTADEHGVIMIENGKYIGYGYLCTEYNNGEIEGLISSINTYADNRDVQQILKNYIRHHSHLKIIPFEAKQTQLQFVF
jgi:DNA polymerase III subunit epsilon